MDAAKPVLHNNTGECACAKAGQICPAEAGRRGKDQVMKHPSSREFFAYWDAEARRCAGARPQRDRARRGARTARRHLRAVLRQRRRLSVSRRRNPGLRPARPRPQGSQLFRAVRAGQPPRDRGHHHYVAEEMLAAIAGITATSRRRHAGASGIAAAAVQHPRACADQPDRRAGAVRKRTRRAQGFQADVVALSRTSRKNSFRARLRKLAIARGFMVYEGLR